jgi:hypothetical protein
MKGSVRGYRLLILYTVLLLWMMTVERVASLPILSFAGTWFIATSASTLWKKSLTLLFFSVFLSALYVQPIALFLFITTVLIWWMDFPQFIEHSTVRLLVGLVAALGLFLLIDRPPLTWSVIAFAVITTTAVLVISRLFIIYERRPKWFIYAPIIRD